MQDIDTFHSQSSDEKPQMKENVFSDAESAILGFFLGFLTMVITIIVLNYFNILQLSKLSSFFSFLPHKSSLVFTKGNPFIPTPTPNNTCSAKLPTYMKISTTHFTADGISGGTFYGTLKKVTYNVGTHTAIVEVVPLNGSNIYMFTLNDQTVRAFNDNTKKFYPDLSQLPVGQNVELTYNCDPQTGNIFTIVTVKIVP